MEPIQSSSSRTAFRAWEVADEEAGLARSEEIRLELQIKRLQAELRAARRVTKAASEAAEHAFRVYEAIPYTEVA